MHERSSRGLVVIAGVVLAGVMGCDDDGCRVTGHVQDEDNDDECSVSAVCDGEDVDVECHDRGDFLDCACDSDHEDAVAAFVVNAPICFGSAGFESDARQFLADACVDRDAVFQTEAPPLCDDGCGCDPDACAFFDEVCDVDRGACVAIVDDCADGRAVLGGGRDPSGPAIFEAGSSTAPNTPEWRFTVRLSQPVGRLSDLRAVWSDGGAPVDAAVVESNIGTSAGPTADVLLRLPQAAPRAVRLITQVGKSNTLCAQLPF